MKRRFCDRYRLARARDEAILLDLESGSYFGVRDAALTACIALMADARIDAAANEVAKKFDVSREKAKRDIEAFLSRLRRGRRKSHGSQFRVTATGYELRGPRGASVMIALDGTVRRRRADSNLLRVAAPHVLAIAGETVLHASAILDAGQTIAFVAASGTGKTTIARLLENRGRPRISDDLVALDSKLRVRVDGERAIREWSRSRERIFTDPALVGCAPTTAPIGAVMLVERTEGLDHVQIDRIGKIAGMTALFENAFVELPVPCVWARALDVSRRFVARKIVYAMRVPEGTRNLSRALREWAARGMPRP
ncbi:MAG: PqqD family peptide modification chaperone [Polyangiaceae bacterium]